MRHKSRIGFKHRKKESMFGLGTKNQNLYLEVLSNLRGKIMKQDFVDVFIFFIRFEIKLQFIVVG